MPIPVAARSKALICGHSLAGIAGSSPTEGMDVCLLWILWGRSLSAFEVELAIDKLKSHKSPGIDEIPAELIKAGGGTICLEIYKLITSIWKKEKLPEEWKESIIVPIQKKGDKTDCNNYRGISLLLTTYKIVSNILLSRLVPYV